MPDISHIAAGFAFEGKVDRIDPLGQGFINDTYIVRTQGGSPDYILQRKNRSIFHDVPAMMDNISRVTAHIRRAVIAAGGDPAREVLTVVPAADGSLCVRDSAGDCWAACVYIPDTVTYDRADSIDLARMGGEGIGRFQAQLSDFNEPLHETIKGFHDIRHRFRQWAEVLETDRVGRCASVAREIAGIEARKEEMLAFRRLVDDGVIPVRVTHNDTKISNILFDRSGRVLCVIDLDTVMAAPALNDFGDAIRSYANTGDEDDRDLSRVSLSMPVFRAYTEGYLSQQAAHLNDEELNWLAFSARYLTFEQELRFLMDYIDGDTYYKTAYADHNLVRARAQHRLLESMEEHYDEMCGIVADIAAGYR
ncbi:MAG: aminoglycoside phosphotransferase family protein [Muribaculaceae bacterium]|nr:aminoglycoside phosphotransferase family protein [Muribaculaceae bacterium]